MSAKTSILYVRKPRSPEFLNTPYHQDNFENRRRFVKRGRHKSYRPARSQWKVLRRYCRCSEHQEPWGGRTKWDGEREPIRNQNLPMGILKVGCSAMLRFDPPHKCSVGTLLNNDWKGLDGEQIHVAKGTTVPWMSNCRHFYSGYSPDPPKGLKHRNSNKERTSSLETNIFWPQARKTCQMKSESMGMISIWYRLKKT